VYIWVLSNCIGGAGEMLLRVFGDTCPYAFCTVLFGLSVYWPSVRSLWMGVLVSGVPRIFFSGGGFNKFS
jgi:hypothetical protein